MNQIIRIEQPISINIAPDIYHRHAVEHYECKQTFKCSNPFSPLPYFLLCRAIELELKARYLKIGHTRDEARKFGHRLIDLYHSINETILDLNEVNVLTKTSTLYDNTRLSYLDPIDVFAGYSEFPELEVLDAITKKLIYASNSWRIE